MISFDKRKYDRKYVNKRTIGKCVHHITIGKYDEDMINILPFITMRRL
jgi:hypothetical protein